MSPTYPVVPFTVHGTGTGVAQRVVVPQSSHAFHTDAYPAFGGADEAPSPLFYALGALTSCNQVTAQLVAKDLGITLGRLAFEATGDLDTSVLVGAKDGNANFRRVVVAASVETDATPQQFELLQRETERRCPVSQLFIRSGVDYSSTWTRAKVEVTV